MNKITFYIVGLILLFVNYSNAQQTKDLPSNSEGFLKDVSDLLQKDSEDKKAAKLFLEEFELLWNSGTISDEEKKTIYYTSNSLLKKRAMVYPHLNDYIFSIFSFFKTNHNINSYHAWDKSIHSMFNNKKLTLRNVQSFLDMTVNLFKTNSIYKSTTTEWRASNNDFKFVYDYTPKIIYGEMDLTCLAKRDSIKILNTKGVYYPLEEDKWEGAGGKVTWERAGFKPDEVYVLLGNYKIKMSQSKYEADTVSFMNTNYFNKPLLGSFEEKTTEIANAESAAYPRFVSFTKRFFIKNIYENVDYDGGFSMQGAKFLGSGSKEEPAKLFFYRNDSLFLTASSKLYTLRKDRIIGTNTAVNFVIAQDSIYHLGLLFKYFVDKREVELIRDGEGMSRSPFFNTYHKFDMDFEYLTWKIDDPKMDFKMMKGSTDSKAVFESENYFSQYRYEKLQGMDEKNPLSIIKIYIDKYGVQKFYATDLANYMRKDVTQVRHVLLNLTFLGIIKYDFEDDLVTVPKRFFDYVSSHAGRIDYDVISFNSDTKGSDNASLNLLNNELKIHGVSQIQLSDSQNVVIFPENEEILVKKNRDFEFGGKIRAGLFIYSGKEFSFEYDNFKINLTNVDSLRLMVETNEVDMYGNKKIRNIKTLIENINGDLLIDNPFNKSGVKSFPEYPIFNSKKDSYVYYDKKTILNGAYKRDNFYFQVYPYTLDSLDNFRTEGLQFKGYFVSGGIFPPFEENLMVQKDYSLGFIRKTPPAGYPLYAGKATFKNDIKLSHDGLRGDGDFLYITSTTKSNDFIFFPDSMTTIAQKMHIEKQLTGVEFPTVDALNVYVHYHPKEDEFYSVKQEIPQVIFDGQASLHGTLKLQPVGLTGWGMLEFSKAELHSDEFKFSEHIVDADTSQFNLKALDLAGFAFKTDNVNAHVDFKERKGEFKSNGEGSVVEFPQNQYICFMEQFTWYMDQEEIEVSANKKNAKPEPGKELSAMELEDIQLSGSEFTSINPVQDSLSFIAPSAKFNMRKNIITANEVKYIRVADATVYLSDGEVVIEKQAKMRTLSNTKIIANNIDRFHTINNCTTNIFGKKQYSSSGDYDYVDENEVKQNIHFDIITVDTLIQTYATGKINVTENFTLNPNFVFTGNVRLDASIKYLTFSGSTKIAHECAKYGNYWVNFSSDINPKQIYIPISLTPSDINNNNLINGVILSVDTPGIYSAFLSKPKNYSDLPVITADGFLFYDNVSKQYKISNKEKLVEINLPGNYLSLNKEFCNLYGEGKINLGADLGQVKLESVGNVNYNSDKGETYMDILLSVNFMFSDQALKTFTEEVNNDVTLQGVDLTRKTYEKNIMEILGKEEAEKLKSEIALNGSMKRLPKEFEKSLFISDLKMKWDTAQDSYVSDGKIGIGNILKYQVNKMLDGYVVIKKKRSGDIITMYFQIDDSKWYYFQYRSGQMLALSSNPDFVANIRDLKIDKRKMEVEKGQKSYQFYIASEKSKNDFLKKIKEGIPDEDEEGEGKKGKKEEE